MDNDLIDKAPISAPRPKTIKIKTVIIIVAILILGALLFYFKGFFVAATVDGRPISRFEVIDRIEKQSGKAALDAIVNEYLIDKEARVKGITITNDEIDHELKTIETQISEQGRTLDDLLKAQGLGIEDLKKQISLQKQVEKILSEKTQVSESEVEQYIKDNAVTIPEGQESDYKNQIKDQLRGQKMDQEFTKFLDGLHATARINYFIKY